MTVRDLVVTQNVTLDGVVDAAGGWFGVSVSEPPAALRLVEARAFRSGVALLRYRTS